MNNLIQLTDNSGKVSFYFFEHYKLKLLNL